MKYRALRLCAWRLPFACFLLLAPSVVFAGVQTYTTPGTYTFTVPAYGTLTVTVDGSGGEPGGSGQDSHNSSPGSENGQTWGVPDGLDGGFSSFNGTVIGYGGGGGRRGGDAGNDQFGISGLRGTDGIATGGDINIAGGGGPGYPSSGAYPPSVGIEDSEYLKGGYGGSGGNGGRAIKTYPAGELAVGSVIKVVVSERRDMSALHRANGSVSITWTEGTSQSPHDPDAPVCTIVFDDNTVQAGEDTVIHYRSQNATVFYINNIGYVGSSGDPRIVRQSSADYSGFVSGPHGTASCPASLIVTTSSNVGGCRIGSELQDDRCVLTACPIGYSRQNGQCVRASCPAGYMLREGRCVTSECPPGQIRQQTSRGYTCIARCPRACAGSSLVDTCTGETVQSCAHGCMSGSCNMAPSPAIVSWRVSPLLVRRGSTVSVAWEARNVRSCSVTGTNSDGTGTNMTGAWNGLSGTKISSGLMERTTYTIGCQALPGAVPEIVTRSAIVNIAPVFNEQ